MKSTQVRKEATAPAVAKQAPTRTKRPPAEFKLVRLRECPVDSALVDNPDHVEKLWREHVVTAPWFNADKECLVVFLLNTRRHVMGFELLSQGTKDTVLVNYAEVFRLAVARNVSAIIIAHNHPSGDPTPSEGDIKVTRDCLRAGALLKIDVLDHVVMGRAGEGRAGRASLRELGYFYDYDQVSGYRCEWETTHTASAAPATGSPAAGNQAPTSGKAAAVFQRMELEVQQTLAVLDLFASGLAEMHEAKAEATNEQAAAQVAGYRALASGAADDLFRHWQASCADANQMGKQGRPAWSQLDVSVAVAAMLMERFGNELEGHALENDKWHVKREGREPRDRFGFYSLGQDRADALCQEFDLAWEEWRALEKASEQRAAA